MVCLLSVSSDVPQCWHCLQGTRLIPSALECLRPALYCISISKEQRIWSHHMEIQYRAGRKHSNADGMSRVPCKQCQHCGTSEDTDSKHTIHTAVSQKSDITHSGDMSLVKYCISISKEQRIWSHLAICPSGSLKLRSQRSELWSLLMKWVEKGTKPSYDSIRGENYVMQSLHSQWNRLVIHESLLCREWKVIGTTTFRPH
jgi:hypothetical protein